MARGRLTARETDPRGKRETGGPVEIDVARGRLTARETDPRGKRETGGPVEIDVARGRPTTQWRSTWPGNTCLARGNR